ncbi:fructan beta-fructosidase [Rheinheimera pacifica]|uniref:Fructan beta-fructosidase n=1 Tax=Rheinheimera pacifica TaxID=173990 RepID=A0A1H6K251_9GAMM|nr:glycoside hydrolase family 32 protein [Rheinheimera pacifica]SEH67359.1 fructan beta-fructosidase [Rheinheimera pacifica]
MRKTVLALCLAVSSTMVPNALAVDDLYQEPHRPQFHFSPEQQWMNDPNGMVYLDGEYHLFYQYNPYSNIWGPMHWGHAISKDLVQWEQQPIALYPDQHGTIFSGSAVVDWNNTSDFGSKDKPAMVAIYTYHDHLQENFGSDTFQSQGIAYSLDNGRTWTKYDANPVLKSPDIRDFRDPKVSWHEDSERWVMSLAVKDKISFYTSTDLKNWQHTGDFGQGIGAHGGVWECPDLIKMRVNGSDEEKYVLLVSINPGGPNGGSGTQYFVGDFDGKTFKLDPAFNQQLMAAEQSSPSKQPAVWLDYGTDNYAGVTWSDVPKQDGRHLFIGWMSNWQYANNVPTQRWRSAMTIARQLELEKRGNSYIVSSQPVASLSSLATDTKVVRNSNVKGGKPVELVKLTKSAELGEHIKLKLDLKQSKLVELSFENAKHSLKLKVDAVAGQLILDRTNAGIADFESGFASVQRAPLEIKAGVVQLEIFLDTSSIEVFADNGRTVMTSVVFPDVPYSQLKLSTDSAVNIQQLSITQLRSIWQK